MEESLDLILARLDGLSRVVEDLQQRTSALERERAPVQAASQVETPPASVPVQAREKRDLAGLAPLAGWAFMGIAGAYLLRAITESGGMPGTIGAVAGILYAVAWLWLAAQKASRVHGLTSALILAPMLWEMTVKFHLLSIEVASGVLVAFAVVGLAVAWKRSLAFIAWIVTLAGLATAIMLFREVHNATVLTVTLLALAAAVEISACRDHWLGLRWLTAFAANAAVYAIGSSSAPAHVLVFQIALLTIYLGSTVDRTILRGLNISWYEVAQLAVAFAVSVHGAMEGAGPLQVGIFCAASGIACYVISFVFLDKKHGRDRNFYVYSTFGLLLVSVATGAMLSETARTGTWSVLAIALMSAGFSWGRDTLRLHSGVFLLMAVVQSKLIFHAADQIMRATSVMDVDLAHLLALAASAGCYALIARHKEGLQWSDSAEEVVAAALMVWGVAGLLAQSLAMYVSPAAPLRTALLTVLAVGAAYCGAHWQRMEWKRLAYP